MGFFDSFSPVSGLFGGGGDLWDDLTGKSDIDSANKANKKNVKAALGEIGDIGSMDEGTLFGLLGSLFGQGADALASNTAKAQSQMGGLFSQGRSAQRKSFDQAIADIRAGYAEAQERVGAQAGAAIEASLASQRQALAQVGQDSINSGLGGAPANALARGIAADSSRGMAGAFAQIGAQQGNLAAQQGESLANQSNILGQGLNQSYTQQAGAQGQTQMQLGQALAQLLQNQAGQFANLGAMRQDARLGVQHVPGPSPLQSFGQLAGGLGSIMGGLG